jgi:DNA-binding FrmR family transcriptional regulator
MAIDNTKDQILKRIARIEGQLRGIQKLIVEDADCEKIAQQMSAARKALEKSHHLMLSCMIEEEIFEQAPEMVIDKQMIKHLLSKYL